MKYFKTKPSRLAKRYEITPKTYNKIIQHKYPFERVNADKSVSQYAICPSCLNPIQIIGIAKRIARTPYGKHTGKSIDGLPDWQQIKYEFCPYAVKNKKINLENEEILPEITQDIVELYELLKSQFDRAVYVISEALDIKCSSDFWKNVLRQYLTNDYYCSPRLTEVNLPYLFAYFGMSHNNPFGQSVKKDSELYYKLKSHKSVDLTNDNKYNQDFAVIKQTKFFRFEFRFTGYKCHAESGKKLTESMMFCVDDILTGQTFFEKEIVFDETYFMNVINSKKSEKYRNQHLLDIAQSLMPPLC